MSDNSPQNWNQKIIEEFRSNGGQVGGQFAGAPLLLLTTTGARSGRKLTSPLMYNKDGDCLVIFASKGGAPTNPDWYYNLVANPEVTIEQGSESYTAKAVVLEGEDRERIFTMHATQFPQFASYQEGLSRKIPVIALEREG